MISPSLIFISFHNGMYRGVSATTTPDTPEIHENSLHAIAESGAILGKMNAPDIDAGRATRGRPRSTRIDDAVIAATQRILDEEGYWAVSVEAVARAAETSRPAIYRRWSGRPALVLATISARLDVPIPPDTGCTLCDIGESFEIFLAAYRRISPEALWSLYAECARDPELRDDFTRTIVNPARRAVGQSLDLAIERGNLREGVDRDLLLDMVASLVHYRALFGPEHLGEEDAGNALELLLQGAAADYPALLAHSEALELEHEHEHN